MESLVRFAVKEAEAQGAGDAEAYSMTGRESEVFIENNDLKQGKSQTTNSMGIRVLLNGSLGFYSINNLSKDRIKHAVSMAIKIARISPRDKYNLLPDKSKVNKLHGIYDKNAELFEASDAGNMAVEMLQAAKSYDDRVSIDSGNFSGNIMSHSLANSHGVYLNEKLSAFSWSIMGMAIADGDVSNFDVQVGSSHHVKNIKVQDTATQFAETVINSLRPRRIESFRGEMLLTPDAVNELVEDAISHSISSDAVQKKSSYFAGKLYKHVATDLLTLEDDATNVEGLGASSFDREGVPHKRNIIIEKGMLKKFLYNTYTAKKDGVRSTGNASGSTISPPSVSATNIVVKNGKTSFDTLISEMANGIILSRFSGNVNPVNGDFSGVVKGGRLVKNGEVKYAVKEVMVAGNIFDALRRHLTGVSRERKVIYDSILPFMRFDNISFTAG
jgi:PmbA protein